MFEESKKISTYLFAIVAGPYSFIESKKKDFAPMKVFFRQSLKEKINKEALEEMISIT